MKYYLLRIIDWIEVWGLLIPLTILLIRKNIPEIYKAVKLYLWLVLPFYLLSDIIFDYKIKYHFPNWLQSNNYLYNSISIIRLICFSIFFIQLKQPFLKNLKKIVPIFFILFVIINFTFYEYFFNYYFLSNRLLATESGILLFYCLQYYFFIFLKDDQNVHLNSLPSFWIVTGLGIYIVISFPIYIFYKQLVLQSKTFGIDIWQIQNLAYLLFSIFIAIGFYKCKND